MFTLLWAIFIAFLVGAIAKMIIPGSRLGCAMTILLGIAGCVLATWLGRFLHYYHGREQAGFMFSILGALIILHIGIKYFRQQN